MMLPPALFNVRESADAIAAAASTSTNKTETRKVSFIAPRNTLFPVKLIQGCGTLAKNSACYVPDSVFSSYRKEKGYFGHAEPIKEKCDFSCTISSLWFLRVHLNKVSKNYCCCF